jgi:hypothetical protein
MALGKNGAQKGPHPFATRAAITQLARLERKSFGPRHKKTDFYEYLDGVLKLYLSWKDRNRAGKEARAVLAKMDQDRVKVRSNTHTIRSIIDASSKKLDALSEEGRNEEKKKRSRWTNALRLAVRNKATVKQIGLGGFFGRNGGPAGCARQMAAIQKAKKATRGPVRAPKVTTRSSGP